MSTRTFGMLPCKKGRISIKTKKDFLLKRTYLVPDETNKIIFSLLLLINFVFFFEKIDLLDHGKILIGKLDAWNLTFIRILQKIQETTNYLYYKVLDTYLFTGFGVVRKKNPLIITSPN